MVEAELVSTPEGCTNNSPITPNPYISTNNPSAGKSLSQFTETLYVKHKTAVWRFGAAEAKHNSIKKAICCDQTLKSAARIQK